MGVYNNGGRVVVAGPLCVPLEATEEDRFSLFERTLSTEVLQITDRQNQLVQSKYIDCEIDFLIS